MAPLRRYSVYTYPSSVTTTRSNSPLVGLVSLTNATQAASEFYSVRNMHNPLTPDATASPNPNASGGVNVPANSATGKHVVSGGIIALGTVLGFVGLAAALFCAWWFWLRRKHGRNGVVAAAAGRKSSASEPEEMDMATLARRSKKFKSMQRQKSMIDGYSDFDVDSWGGDGDSKTDDDTMSRTGTGRSIDTDDERRNVIMLPAAGALGMEGSNQMNGVSSGGNRESRRRISAWESSYPPTGWSMDRNDSPTSTPRKHRNKSPSVATVNSLLPGVSASPTRGRFDDAESTHSPHPAPKPLSITDLPSPTKEALLGGLDAGYDSDDRFGSTSSSRPRLGSARSFSQSGSIIGIMDPMQEEQADVEVPRRRL